MTALSVHGACGRAQNPISYTDTYGLEGRVELCTAQLARSCAGRAEHRIQMGKNMADDLRGGTYHGRMSENVRIAETRNPRQTFPGLQVRPIVTIASCSAGPSIPARSSKALKRRNMFQEQGYVYRGGGWPGCNTAATRNFGLTSAPAFSKL